ncbi:MAG: ABC transporter ATP-binding protein, partial [Lachnospiraceae bacterium]|nr:ABC transporter ATP-binding protein [Lachnospiraceae bacterium]
MIEVRKISKSFDGFKAVNDVTVTITDKNVFGMVGTNGAGKSTVLRMIAGVYKPDEGIVLIDGQPVFDKMETKRKLFFIADEPYFFNNATAEEMQKYYGSIYENYDKEQFFRYLTHFELDKRRKINTYSKGMKKQLALLLGICAKTKYLLCDETFDGLDPVMRQGIKSIFAEEIERRGMTPVIASHNLRELEDICDHVGLLHKGGVLLSKDLEEMKLNIQKVQCVF